MRAKSSKNMGKMNNLADAKHCQHAKPNKHDRPKRSANYFCAKTLEHEQKQNNHQHNFNYEIIAGNNYITQAAYLIQAFYCRSYRNRWGDNAISQQSASTNNCRVNQVFAITPHQCIQRKNPAFTVVISLKGYKHIFKSSLQGEGPENTGNSSKNKLFCNFPSFAYYGLKSI